MEDSDRKIQRRNSNNRLGKNLIIQKKLFIRNPKLKTENDLDTRTEIKLSLDQTLKKIQPIDSCKNPF